MLLKDVTLLDKIRSTIYEGRSVEWELDNLRFAYTWTTSADGFDYWHIRAAFADALPDDVPLLEVDDAELRVCWDGKRGAVASRVDALLKAVFNHQCGIKANQWKASFYKVSVVHGLATNVYRPMVAREVLHLPLEYLPPVLVPDNVDVALEHVDLNLVEAMRGVFDKNSRGTYPLDDSGQLVLVNVGFNDYQLQLDGNMVATIRRWYLTLYPPRDQLFITIQEALCAALFPVDPQDRFKCSTLHGRRTRIRLGEMKSVYFWKDGVGPRVTRQRTQAVKFEDANHYITPTPPRITVDKNSPEYLRAREDLVKETILMAEMTKPNPQAVDAAAMREKAEKEAATQKMLDDLLGPIGG